jgi:UDP-2,4-diacetamido-2,4,6-trideoxy-beta-L-altropyranose hydrolase
MRVLIITEGGREKGYGHITRCASLYEAFEERGFHPEFVINGDESVKELLVDKRYSILHWAEKQNEAFRLMDNVDVAVIDSYLESYDFYKRVSDIVGLAVYIDDFKRLDYPRGMVVNGTIFAEEIDDPKCEDITYLLGNDYILLRQAFWHVPEKEIKENVEVILITLGGNDMRDMAPRILRLLIDGYPKIEKKIIIGRGAKNIEKIEKVKDKNTHLIYSAEAGEMRKTMLACDAAISAGGQTLNELARVGVPTIALAVADNQKNNIRGWQRAGFIEYVGWWNDRECLDKIEKALTSLAPKSVRQRMAGIGRARVDGCGPRRVVQRILAGT